MDAEIKEIGFLLTFGLLLGFGYFSVSIDDFAFTQPAPPYRYLVQEAEAAFDPIVFGYYPWLLVPSYWDGIGPPIHQINLIDNSLEIEFGYIPIEIIREIFTAPQDVFLPKAFGDHNATHTFPDPEYYYSFDDEDNFGFDPTTKLQKFSIQNLGTAGDVGDGVFQKCTATNCDYIDIDNINVTISESAGSLNTTAIAGGGIFVNGSTSSSNDLDFTRVVFGSVANKAQWQFLHENNDDGAGSFGSKGSNLTSVVFWMNGDIENILTATHILATDSENSLNSFAVWTFAGDGSPRKTRTYILESGTTITTFSDPTFPNDTWAMWSMTLNKTAPAEVRICKNGNATCATDTASPEFSSLITGVNSRPLTLSAEEIGAVSSEASPERLTVDELAIWKNYLLTDDELNQIYNSGAGISIMPEPTVVPTGLTGLAGQSDVNGDITLTWNPSSNASNFRLFKDTTPSVSIFDTPYVLGVGNTTSFTDTTVNVDDGITYYYIVQPYNVVGNGTESATVSVTSTAVKTYPDPYLYVTFDEADVISNGTINSIFNNFGTAGTIADGFMEIGTSTLTPEDSLNITASVASGTLTNDGLLGQAVFVNSTSLSSGNDSTWVQFGSDANEGQWRFLTENNNDGIVLGSNKTSVNFWASGDFTGTNTITAMLANDKGTGSFANLFNIFTSTGANDISVRIGNADGTGDSKFSSIDGTIVDGTPAAGDWRMITVTLDKELEELNICINTVCTLFDTPINSWDGVIHSGSQAPLILSFPPRHGNGAGGFGSIHSMEFYADDLAVWDDHILNSTQLDYLYNDGNGREVLPTPVVDTTDLEAYWKFEETSGDLKNANFSNIFPNGNSTSDANIIKSNTGLIGNAWRTNTTGTNQNVKIGGVASEWDFLIGTGNSSHNFWIRDNGCTGSTAYIFDTRLPSGDGQIISAEDCGFASKHLRTNIVGTTSVLEDSPSGSYAATDDTWDMYTIVHDNTNNNIFWYKNGTLIETDPTSTGSLVGTTDHTPRLFNHDSALNVAFNDATVDEWSVWSRILTPTEITNLYNNGNGLELVASAVQAFSQTITDTITVSDTVQTDVISPVDTTDLRVYYKFDVTTGRLPNEEIAELFPQGNSTSESVDSKIVSGLINNAWNITAGASSNKILIGGSNATAEWNFLSGGASRTYNFWINGANTTSGVATIFDTEDSSNLNGAKLTFDNSACPSFPCRMTFTVKDGLSQVSETSGDGFLSNDDTWHMYTMVRRGTTVEWLKDGVSFSNSTGASTSTFDTVTFPSLAGDRFTSASPLSGATIDEWSFWTRQLTHDEIESLYNNGNGLELVAAVAGTPPNAPTGFAGIANITDITLSWNNQTDADSWTLSRNGSDIATGLVNVESYQDVGVALNTPFGYVLTAINGTGSNSTTEVAVISNDIPSVVTGVGAMPINGEAILVQWDDPVADDGEGSPSTGLNVVYDIFRRDIGLGDPFILQTTIPEGTDFFNDTTVLGGHTYGYQISSRNEVGSATNSTEASAMVDNALIVRVFESQGVIVVGTNKASVNLFNSTFTSTKNTDGQGRVSFPELSGDYNFTIRHIQTSFIINKTTSSVTVPPDEDVSVNVSSDVHRVNCPSNGPGADLLIFVNSSSTDHFISSFTEPVCSLQKKVTWEVLYTGFQGAALGSVSDFSTRMKTLVLSLGDFGNDAINFVVNGTTLPTSYANPIITSNPILVNTTTTNVKIIFNELFLQPAPPPPPTITPSPPPPTQTAGGGGTPKLSAQDEQRFFEQLFGFSLFSKIHQMQVGQTQDGSIDITWNSPSPITIEGVEVGDQFITWVGFPDTPFTLDGNDRISTAKIPYRIMPPNQLCDEITGQTINCVDRVLYEIPVKIHASVEGQPLTANTVIKVNLSLDITLALFTIFIAFAAGVGAIIYRAAIANPRQKKREGRILKTKSKERRKIEGRFSANKSKIRRRP